MLVMTRKRDESILVDRNIEITVVEIRGDKVRLGISAPTEVPVHRREVFDSIHGGGEGAEIGSPNGAAPPARNSQAESPAIVCVAATQIAILDRIRREIRDESGAAPRRDQTLNAILAALDEAQDAIGRPLTLEHLRASIAAALKGSTAP